MMLWLKIAIALLSLFFFMLGLLLFLGYIAEVQEARRKERSRCEAAALVRRTLAEMGVEVKTN